MRHDGIELTPIRFFRAAPSAPDSAETDTDDSYKSWYTRVVLATKTLLVGAR